MLDKVVELVKKHPKISDFHLRSECAFSYRLLGEIVKFCFINLQKLYQLIINFHNFAPNGMKFEYVTHNKVLS